MRIALYTIMVSPHQLPFARELIARVGEENFRYVYLRELETERIRLGWGMDVPHWCLHEDDVNARVWLNEAEVLISGERRFKLFKNRAARGLRSFYMSERWFKEPLGMLRLLHPRFLLNVIQLLKLTKSGALTLLPIGVHALGDFKRIGVPDVAMHLWGYFVDLGQNCHQEVCGREGREFHDSAGRGLRVLWVGRMIPCKRVDVIVRAVARCSEITLTLVGDGPEKARIQALAEKSCASQRGKVVFRSSVPIAEVRELMRTHDVYVFPSTGRDGWGAVVSEALEEGMQVLGSYEAGATATILPRENLFHSGDWQRLASLLEAEKRGELPRAKIGEWTAAHAADRLLAALTQKSG